MSPNVEDVLATIATEVGDGEPIAIGFSGGRDSTVLLHAATRVFAGRVEAWHVNHHISPDAEAWQRHCCLVSESLGVPFVVDDVRVIPGRAIEQAARTERYRAWKARLAQGQTLLLAHHLDDQVETVLWRVLRGAGTELLKGMPRKRAHGAGYLLRPFLELPRRTLTEYAHRHDLRWVEDPSNADPRHDRSYLRTEIVPKLIARFPHALAGIGQSASALARDAAIITSWLDERLVEHGATVEALPTGVLDDRDAEALLRRWLDRHGVVGVPPTRLREIATQAHAAPSRTPAIDVAPGLQLRRYRGYLRLVADTSPFEPRTWSLAQPLELAHGRLEATLVADGTLTPDLEEVEVRSRRAGDRVVLAGRRGTHDLKHLFQEAAIPPWERGRYPLLVHRNELVMLPGIGVAARYAARGRGWCVNWITRTPFRA